MGKSDIFLHFLSVHDNTDETKSTSANARSALEENFWKLECLALSMEKDRQEMQKQIQTVGRDCSQVKKRIMNIQPNARSFRVRANRIVALERVD